MYDDESSDDGGTRGTGNAPDEGTRGSAGANDGGTGEPPKEDSSLADSVAGEIRERMMGRPQSRMLRNTVMSKLFGTKTEPVNIGPYRVLDTIGSGGMGIVYAAYDNRLDRKIAIKELRGEREWSVRARREATALGKVSHPNVVTIHEAGEHEGRSDIDMDGLGLAASCPVMARLPVEIAPGAALVRLGG